MGEVEGGRERESVSTDSKKKKKKKKKKNKKKKKKKKKKPWLKFVLKKLNIRPRVRRICITSYIEAGRSV